MAYVFTDSGHKHERVANARSIVAAVRFSHAFRSPHNPAGMYFDSKTNSRSVATFLGVASKAINP